MVARIAKFMGRAYSMGSTVGLDVEYNNNIVYSGTVPAITQDVLPETLPNSTPVQELFSFATDTKITGIIPVRISVTGGTLFFSYFRMNYTGNAIRPDGSHVSEQLRIPVPPMDFFSNPTSITPKSDGILNTMKNGDPWEWRVNTGEQLGAWIYPVHASEIFTFDYFVDPECVIILPYIPYTIQV